MKMLNLSVCNQYDNIKKIFSMTKLIVIFIKHKFNIRRSTHCRVDLRAKAMCNNT